jgi:hypothetical protein
VNPLFPGDDKWIPHSRETAVDDLEAVTDQLAKARAGALARGKRWSALGRGKPCGKDRLSPSVRDGAWRTHSGHRDQVESSGRWLYVAARYRRLRRLSGAGWQGAGTPFGVAANGSARREVVGVDVVVAAVVPHPGPGSAWNGRRTATAIVPSSTAGFTVSKKYSKVGWNGSDTRELSFADCRVPAENLLGQRGRGFAPFLSIWMKAG